MSCLYRLPQCRSVVQLEKRWRQAEDLPTKILETEASILENEFTLTRLHTALGYQSPYETKLKEYEQRLAEIDKELLGKTEEVEELVDAETEELSSSKTVSIERESTDSEEHVQEETIEDRTPAGVAVNDLPGEAVEVPTKQAPRFKRRQTADRGR